MVISIGYNVLQNKLSVSATRYITNIWDEEKNSNIVIYLYILYGRLWSEAYDTQCYVQAFIKLPAAFHRWVGQFLTY